MLRVITFLFGVSLSFVFFSLSVNPAFAERRFGDPFFGAEFAEVRTLANDNTPIEQGACTFNDDNMLFKLPAGTTNSIDILQYPQNMPNVDQIIKDLNAGTGNIFGSSDACVNMGDSVIFGLQQGGELGAIKCDGPPDNLCLNNNRFNVTLDWQDFSTTRTFQDPDNPGRVYVGGRDDTEDSLFYFFSNNGESWELLIKILDATGASDGAVRHGAGINNGRFWVFYGALTNVEYELTVTDTSTGVSRPLGQRTPSQDLQESDCKAIPNTDQNLCVFFDENIDMIKAVQFPSPLMDPNDVQIKDLAPPPPFENGFDFFNISIGADNNGNAVVTWPGQEQLFIFDPLTGKLLPSGITPPWNDLNSGAGAIAPITDPNAVFDTFGTFFVDGFESGNVSAWSYTTPGSLELYQFIIFRKDRSSVSTLSEWGLIALSGVLMLMGALYIRRKAKA